MNNKFVEKIREKFKADRVFYIILSLLIFLLVYLKIFNTKIEVYTDQATGLSVAEVEYSTAWFLKIPAEVDGNKIYRVQNEHNKYTNDLLFPNVRYIYIEEGIEEVSSSAFTACKNLRRVSFPSTIKVLGEGSFKYCSKLEEVEFEQIQESARIEYEAFRETGITEIIIPEGVSQIESYAFFGCVKLKNVILPDSLKEMGKSVFGRCDKLKEIKLPNGIDYISNRAFFNTALKTVIIPEKVKRIKSEAFGLCNSLESVILSEQTQLIEKYAFELCENIVHLEFTDNLIVIDDSCLYGKIKEMESEPPFLSFYLEDGNSMVTSVQIEGEEIKFPKRLKDFVQKTDWNLNEAKLIECDEEQYDKEICYRQGAWDLVLCIDSVGRDDFDNYVIKGLRVRTSEEAEWNDAPDSSRWYMRENMLNCLKNNC